MFAPVKTTTANSVADRATVSVSVASVTSPAGEIRRPKLRSSSVEDKDSAHDDRSSVNSADHDDDRSRQDRKDVERDSFIVNGCYVSGSAGYAAVLTVVTEALLDEDAALGEEYAREMAVEVSAV